MKKYIYFFMILLSVFTLADEANLNKNNDLINVKQEVTGENKQKLVDFNIEKEDIILIENEYEPNINNKQYQISNDKINVIKNNDDRIKKDIEEGIQANKLPLILLGIGIGVGILIIAN